MLFQWCYCGSVVKVLSVVQKVVWYGRAWPLNCILHQPDDMCWLLPTIRIWEARGSRRHSPLILLSGWQIKCRTEAKNIQGSVSVVRKENGGKAMVSGMLSLMCGMMSHLKYLRMLGWVQPISWRQLLVWCFYAGVYPSGRLPTLAGLFTLIYCVKTLRYLIPLACL